jgi:Glycosyl transferases group 1/DUF based on E. rectale Gene description (DUF3880)
MARQNLAGGLAPAPLRVCLLAERNPNACWVPHYADAFKEHCDTITVGTSLEAGPPRNDAERLLFEMVRPNDLELAEPTARCLLDSLPTGWHPQLIVALQSGGPVLQGMQQIDCPTAYVTIDTWHDPNEYANARHYDFVFAAQSSFVTYLRATGSSRVSWLPLACSPKCHYPVQTAKDFDIVFVGSTDQRIYDQRARRLQALGAQFGVATLKTYLQEEVRATSSRGKLAFNSSAFHDVNMRVFETLAMGCPLLTDANARANGLFDLFEDGTHLIAYSDEDLVEKAGLYLEDHQARDGIARAGRAEVLARHTYAHRVATIIDTVRQACPSLDASRATSLRVPVSGEAHLPAVPGTVATLDPDTVTPADPRAKRVIRVVPEGESQGMRDSDVVPWPERHNLAGRMDTVVAINPERCGVSLDAIVAAAHEWLIEGGQLMFGLPVASLPVLGIDATHDSVAAWFLQKGFHIIDLVPTEQRRGKASGPAYLIAARKRTRTLGDVCQEVYVKHPMTGLSLDELRAAIPEGL